MFTSARLVQLTARQAESDNACMRADDLLNRLDDQPFKPFRIHLSDGSVIRVDEPGMVIVGKSSAVLPTRFGKTDDGRRIAEDWQTIALRHIVRFTDAAARENGSRRPRR